MVNPYETINRFSQNYNPFRIPTSCGYNYTSIMKRHYLTFLLLILILVACGQEISLPVPQDASEIVTLSPNPTITPVPTAIPRREDASGIGVAFFKAWENNDILGMYSLLTPQSQALVDGGSFVESYQNAMNTATAHTISSQILSANQEGDSAEMAARVTWDTTAVGSIVRDLIVPLAYENGR
jgi:hypothetical protein